MPTSSGEFAEADARLAEMHGYRAIGETEQAVMAERLGLARLVGRLERALEAIAQQEVPATRESIDVAASTLYICLPLLQLARERVKLEDELADALAQPAKTRYGCGCVQERERMVICNTERCERPPVTWPDA